MTTREELIIAVRGIIGQYAGMRLTLRQIYYRLVAGQVILNVLSSYKRLSDVIARAREAGLVPWGSIEDRTREIHDGHGEDNTAGAHFRLFWNYVTHMNERYEMPKWWGQPTRVIVVLEKEALYEVFRQITDAEGVDLVPVRGYSSVTLLHDLSARMQDMTSDGGVESINVLYFGDFDPSGADIQREVAEKLEEYGADFEIERVAITREQIEEMGLPPAPAKTTDSRYERFLEEQGVAWQVELDAIEPRTLQGLIRDAIQGFFDDALGRERNAELQRRRDRIREWLDGAVNPDFEMPGADE